MPSRNERLSELRQRKAELEQFRTPDASVKLAHQLIREEILSILNADAQ